MKNLKRITSALLAVLMLGTTGFDVLISTASAEETPAETEAILEMDSVLGAGTDTEAPVIDLTTLSIDAKTHELHDVAVLRVKIKDASEIKSVYAFFREGDDMREGGEAMHYNAQTGYYEREIECQYLGEWILTSISAKDVFENEIEYHNEKYFTEAWFTPTANLDAGSFTVVNNGEDQTAPIVTAESFSVSNNTPLAGSWVTYKIHVIDDSPITEIRLYISNYGDMYGVGESLSVNTQTGDYEFDGLISQYGTYEVGQITIVDKFGNRGTYYNSAASTYEGQLPAVDMSGATVTTADSNPDDHTPPSIDISTFSITRDAESYYPKLSFAIDDESALSSIWVEYTFDGQPNNIFVCDNLNRGTGFVTFNDKAQKYEMRIWGGSYGDRFKLESVSLTDANGNRATYYDTNCYREYVPENANIIDFSPLSFTFGPMGAACYKVETSEELKETVDNADGWTQIYVKGDENFTLTESITIPNGVYLNIQSGSGSFKIAEGATLTTASPFTCSVPMEVEGTFANTIEGCWVSLDSLLVAETGCVKVNGSTHVDKILVEGTLENGGTIWVNGDLLISDAGRVTNNGSITVCGTYANDGTVEQGENGSIHRYYTVSTVEDIIAMAATARKGDTIVLESGGKKFIIDRDVTIPEGVSLQFSETLVIAKGAMLTTSDIDVPKMMVNGTWKNYGNPNLYQGLTIGESGVVENNGYLRIFDQYENHGRLINGSNGSARLSLRAEDEAELLDALACDDPGQKEIDFYISGEMTITEDVQIPTNTDLNIFDSTGEGKATLTIDEGTTLTNFSSSFDCYVPMIVAGTLTNVGGVRMEKGLTITAAGTVDTTSGWFNLNGPLVNNGTLVKGSNVHQTLEAHSADELQSALAAMASSGEVRLKSESEVVLSSDIVIPKGITVEVYESVQSLRIAAGSKLVIDAEATLRSYAPLVVEGNVDNYGAIGARKGLSVTGKIDNYNYIRVEGNVVGAENIRDHEAGNQSIRQQYAVDSEESLTNTLNTIPVSSRDWIRLMAAEGFALTKDITIPAGVYLEIQTGEFKVNSGATLTTYDNLIVNGDMRVDGCWENLWNRTDQTGYGHSEVGGILTVNGTVKNSGHIELRRYSEVLKSEQEKIQNSDSGQLNISATVTSMEELQKISEIESCSNKSAIWQGVNELKLDKDLTIPDGIRFYADDAKIIIPMGVTLTVGNNAYILADSIDVQGTLLNNGSIFSSAITESGKIVNHSFLRSDSINVSGELINTSRLMCHNDITVSGQLTNSNSVSFSTLCIEGSGYVGNAGVLMGKIESHGRLEQTERAEENMMFNISLENSCDWKDVFANIRSGDTIVCDSWHEDAYVEITEDTTLPENVAIDWLNFRVKEGITFTTRGSSFKPYTLQVDGTWVNNGSVELNRLVVNGNVQNNGSIITREAVTGKNTVTGNPVGHMDINVYGLHLQETLRNAAPGDTISCYIDYGNGSSQILNEDLTVPEGVTLKFSGVSKVYLTAGHTLTVNGTLLMQQQLYVAGDLVINGEVALPSADEVDLGQVQYLGLTSGSISVIEGGSCTLNGSIRVGKTDYTGQPVENPRSLITGVAMEDWSLRDVDDYWYLTKKPAVDKAEVFCSLPVAGCKLRLVDESGNVRELMPSGGYALITDITSGAYTLEASKPGYVTHTYKIDTTTLSDVLNIELVRLGDINGTSTAGGDVDATDMQCLYTLLSTGSYAGQIADEEYRKAVADVNGDGVIDILDYQRLYMLVQESAALS